MSIYTSSARRGLLSWLWTPTVEQLRFRNRVNLKNPLPPHFKRAKMLRICEPIFANEPKVCQKYAESSKHRQPITENPYGAFLAKEMRKRFYEHPMIAIFHTNSFIMHQFLHIRGMLFDNKFDMFLKVRQSAKVIKAALEGTKFEPAIPLLNSHITLGFCKTTDVSKLLKLTKKMPPFVLIGVIVDNRLLNKADFEYYASIPNITSVHAQLSQTLSSIGGQSLSSLLAANTLALSQSLTSLAGSSNNSKESDNNLAPTPESISESEKDCSGSTQ